MLEKVAVKRPPEQQRRAVAKAGAQDLPNLDGVIAAIMAGVGFAVEPRQNAGQERCAFRGQFGVNPGKVAAGAREPLTKLKLIRRQKSFAFASVARVC